MTYPAPSEYAPFYHTYIGKISPEADLVALMKSQFEDTVKTLSSLSEEQQLHRYAPGKWSIREVVGHLVDTERVMAYRAMRIGRGDTTPLPGFEQDDYIEPGEFDARSMDSLLAEWWAIRQASVALAASMSEKAAARMGTASGYPFSARAALYIIVGHEKHHMGVIRDRYLAN